MLDYRTETFLTLYEEMNYRRTAERLQMTQPGVTQHIHYLENYSEEATTSCPAHKARSIRFTRKRICPERIHTTRPSVRR